MTLLLQLLAVFWVQDLDDLERFGSDKTVDPRLVAVRKDYLQGGPKVFRHPSLHSYELKGA